MEQALLERGVLGIVVIALAMAVLKLYNDNKALHAELRDNEREHRQQVIETQIAFHETSRDQTEQMLQEVKGFSDRLIALATSSAELNERTANKLSEITESHRKSFRAIEGKIDNAFGEPRQ